jgi:phosphatidylglycerophosphate synthase
MLSAQYAGGPRAATVTDEPAAKPSLRQLQGAVKGGDFLTLWVDQRAGSALAWVAARLGLTPDLVSVLGGVAAVITAAAAIAVDGGVVAAVIALLGFHLAYALDCADGQLARATGRTSPRGAVIDLVFDYVSHVCVGVTVAVYAASADVHWALVLAIIGSSSLSFGSFLGGVEAGRLGRGTYERTPGTIAAVARAAQDWGLHLTVLGPALATPARVAAIVLAGTAAIPVVFAARRLRA